MTKLNELLFVFIDTETTGLDENIHELIEVAALVYDPVQDKIIEEFESKVAPRHIETASPYALKINGYINNPGLYSSSLESTMIRLSSIVDKKMIVGQNIDFDLKFIKKAMAEYNIDVTWTRHRKLDTLSLAWFAVKDTNIPGLSLKDLCEYFNISNVGAHSALIDCRRTFELYMKLCSIYGRMPNDI